MRDLFVIIALVALAVGCSKTPDGIVNEKDMARLMADMYKAEVIYEDNEGKYNNDSLKLALRESVLAKHNVSPAQFDTTLIWYAHNLEVYNEVYDDVVKILDEEKRELAKSDFTGVADMASSVSPSVPRYMALGDTADVWGRNRTWIMLPGFADNIITFDNAPDKDVKKGDKYELAFKTTNLRRSMRVFLGIDYKDGSTAYTYRTASNDGWTHCRLQCDTTREVKRIYGYMMYKSSPSHIAYVDSVELLRTHLDVNAYDNALKSQKWIGVENVDKNKSGEIVTSKDEDEIEPKKDEKKPKKGIDAPKILKKPENMKPIKDVRLKIGDDEIKKK